MIWEYREVSSSEDGHAAMFRASAPSAVCGKALVRICPFCCSTDMRLLDRRCREWDNPPRCRIRLDEDVGGEREYLVAHVCAICGWWYVFRREENWRRQLFDVFETYTVYSAAWGALKKFDVADLTAPNEELIRYLVANYGERLNIHPRKFEEIVAAIYQAEGYSVRVTSYSGDRGLDVIILDGPGDKEIGIQVRRNKGKIKAEAIRSLAGAMMVNGVTRGAFVTTSSFTRGARMTASECGKFGRPVELINSESFYARLRLRQRALYQNPLKSWSPFSMFLMDPIALPTIHEESRRFEQQEPARTK
jgi:hypothetical protein